MTLPLLRAPSAMPKPHRVQTVLGFAIRTGFAPEFILGDVEGRETLPSLLFAVALPFKTDEVEEVEGFPSFFIRAVTFASFASLRHSVAERGFDA